MWNEVTRSPKKKERVSSSSIGHLVDLDGYNCDAVIGTHVQGERPWTDAQSLHESCLYCTGNRWVTLLTLDFEEGRLIHTRKYLHRIRSAALGTQDEVCQ